MLSSKQGGFFMHYKTYSAEFKMAAIEEYFSRNISIRDFVKEKDIGLSTFESWLTKLRKAGRIGYKRKILHASKEMLPIEVTKEAKEIIEEKRTANDNSFTLETRGMKLTFSINNLKEVLEVINHD